MVMRPRRGQLVAGAYPWVAPCRIEECGTRRLVVLKLAHALGYGVPRQEASHVTVMLAWQALQEITLPMRVLASTAWLASWQS
jgi:hypothetical protein